MDTPINKNPLVSITVCTYNRANFIKQAIQSALDQTYENMEIIIIDDASTDNTFEVIQSIQSPTKPIRYFKNPQNLGLPKSRNKSVAHSNGAYIAILDSDDFWTNSNKIEEQVSFLESNISHALIGSGAVIVDETNTEMGSLSYETESSNIKKKILVENQFVHSSILYRKEMLLTAGSFNTSYKIFEDYDLILRLGRKYELANVSSAMTAYRKHSSNISKKLTLKNKIAYLLILIRNFPYYPNRIQSILRRVRL